MFNYTEKKEIPEDSYVIRVHGTNKYVHLDGGKVLCLKRKMGKCMVFTSKETANQVIELIKKADKSISIMLGKEINNNYEVVSFEDAYNFHGIEEKQMFLN